MAYDAEIEAEGVLALMRPLCGGRVYEEAPPDEESIEFMPGGTKIQPYLVVSFGEPFNAASDRTIAGERQQPMILTFQVKCWASDAGSARATAAAVRTSLRGQQISANSSEIQLGGGGSFAPRSNNNETTRFMRLVTGIMTINMSVDTSA